MSSLAWMRMDQECDCVTGPPAFHLPPPPIPPDFPCDMVDVGCPNLMLVSDAEFKRIGSFPTLIVVLSVVTAAIVILLLLIAFYKFLGRKGRKEVSDGKEINQFGRQRTNEILYEDLSNNAPRPSIPPSSIEMLDVNQRSLVSNNVLNRNYKDSFPYFLSPAPIYEELPDGAPQHVFQDDCFGIFDLTMNQHKAVGMQASDFAKPQQVISQLSNAVDPSASCFSVSSQDRANGGPPTQVGYRKDRNDRSFLTLNTPSAVFGPTKRNNSALQNSCTLQPKDAHRAARRNFTTTEDMRRQKIPPHLVAIMKKCNEEFSGQPQYEILPTTGGEADVRIPPGVSLPSNGQYAVPGYLGSCPRYSSSRSSGSSYGDGVSSSGSSMRNNVGLVSAGDSTSFDSGISPHSFKSGNNAQFLERDPYPQCRSESADHFEGKTYHEKPRAASQKSGKKSRSSNSSSCRENDFIRSSNIL